MLLCCEGKNKQFGAFGFCFLINYLNIQAFLKKKVSLLLEKLLSSLAYLV